MNVRASPILTWALAVAAALGSLLALASTVSAQDSPISAEVDYNQVSIDEVFTLTVTVTGSTSAPEPNLPPIEWATIIDRSPVQLFGRIGSAFVRQDVNYYRLQPTKLGTHAIGPVSVDIGGQTYETEPIEVEVTRAGTGRVSPRPAPPPFVLPGLSPAEEQDAFLVSALVDNPSPYVGQQITYTFRYLSILGFFARPQGYEPPAFTGFWHRQDPFWRDIRDIVGTRRYRGMEVNTLIFPAVEGNVTIEPATITVPPSVFRSGRTLETNPVELEVRSLPEGGPGDFRGAVGDYRVAARVAGGAVANEPLTLTLYVTGRGNLETLPEPDLPELAGWRSFDGESSVNTQITDGVLTGIRTIERVYVPTSPGEFTIPPIPFSFFDPFAEEYRTVTTEPIPLTVAPSSGQESAPLLSDRDEVERLGTDIRHIKPVPGELRPSASPVAGGIAYRLGWAAPLAAIAVAAGLKLYGRRQRDPVEARRRAAYRNAMRAIDSPGAGASPAGAAGTALSAYLGDVLGRGIAGMTQAELAEALAEHGAGEALAGRVLDALSLSEDAKFAPGLDPAGDGLLEEVRHLLADLEREINP